MVPGTVSWRKAVRGSVDLTNVNTELSGCVINPYSLERRYQESGDDATAVPLLEDRVQDEYHESISHFLCEERAVVPKFAEPIKVSRVLTRSEEWPLYLSAFSASSDSSI